MFRTVCHLADLDEMMFCSVNNVNTSETEKVVD